MSPQANSLLTLTLAAFLWLASLPAVVAQAAAQTDAGHIGEFVIRGNKALNKESIISIIAAKGIKKGDPVTQHTLDVIKTALVSTGLFGEHSASDAAGVNVHTDATEASPGVRNVIIELDENDTIKQVSITGSGPIKPEDIQKLLLLKPGDVYNSVRFLDDVVAIQNLYNAQGYQATLTADSGPDPANPSTLKIVLQVDRISEIKIVGASPELELDIWRLLQIRVGDYFNRNLMSNETRRIDDTKLCNYVSPAWREIGPGREEVTYNVEEIAPIRPLQPASDSEPAPNPDKPKLVLPPGMRMLVSAAFSPDDRYVATFSNYDKKVNLWNARTGKPIRNFAMPGSFFYSGLSFSRNGEYLAAPLPGDGNPFVIWSVRTGRVRWQGNGAEGIGVGVAFSPDGRILVGADNIGDGDYTKCRVTFWNMESGAVIRSLRLEQSEVPMGIAFSPGSDMLAVACLHEDSLRRRVDGSLYLIDSRTGKIRWRQVSPEPLMSAAITPDGNQIFACGPNAGVIGWAIATGRPLRTLPAFPRIKSQLWHFSDRAFQMTMTAKNAGEQTFPQIVISPNGRFVAVGQDRVRVWDRSTNKVIQEFNAPSESVAGMAFEGGSSRLRIEALLIGYSKHSSADITRKEIVILDLPSGKPLQRVPL